MNGFGREPVAILRLIVQSVGHKFTL